jgi:hypothetical protein
MVHARRIGVVVAGPRGMTNAPVAFPLYPTSITVSGLSVPFSTISTICPGALSIRHPSNSIEIFRASTSGFELRTATATITAMPPAAAIGKKTDQRRRRELLMLESYFQIVETKAIHGFRCTARCIGARMAKKRVSM